MVQFDCAGKQCRSLCIKSIGANSNVNECVGSLPGAIPKGIDIFVIGDVHGQADLLGQVLQAIQDSPQQSKERYLDFIGDLIDRGSSSLRAVSLAMQAMTLAQVDELHVMPGNHDLMLLNAIASPDGLKHWAMNDGQAVLAELGMMQGVDSWECIIASNQLALSPDYLHKMSAGSTHLYRGDRLFVHAGVHPSEDIPDFLAQDRFDFYKEDHWASIRYLFLNWQGGWDHTDSRVNRRDRQPTVIVHGYTPALRKVLSLADELLICDRVDEYRAIDL